MKGSASEQNAATTVDPALQSSHLPMWIYDRETLRFLDVSEGATELYGYSRQEFLGLTLSDLGPIDESTHLQYLDPKQVNGSHCWPHMRKDGSRLQVGMKSNALLFQGKLARLVVVRDLTSAAPISADQPDLSESTQPAIKQEELLLEKHFEEALKRADRTGRRVALVCLDIDNIDELFERLTPDGVDECLRHIQTSLFRRVRGMDAVTRTGPKTFTIVLAELDDDFDLYRISEALLKVFLEPIVINGEILVVRASAGIAVYPNDGHHLTKLCHAADTAMHQARSNGGHRVSVFSHEVRERTELDAYMRDALRRGVFRLHYQPQYSRAGEIRTLEVLLRLPGKERGYISPDLFIPIAEETGMIEQLGMWVISEASRQVKSWQREFGKLVHVAVNVSPLQLSSLNFAENALSAIRSQGVVPASIEFEITERAVLNFDEVAEPMRKLAEAGIIFAVDDFGTGYSSLQHLHRLPISVLKIDRSFVQRMGVPQGAEAIIEAIVAMAHSLGMQVVAEGVETYAQRHAATRMGCDAIQGFLHSAAIEATCIPEIMGWVHEPTPAC